MRYDESCVRFLRGAAGKRYKSLMQQICAVYIDSNVVHDQ